MKLYKTKNNTIKLVHNMLLSSIANNVWSFSFLDLSHSWLNTQESIFYCQVVRLFLCFLWPILGCSKCRALFTNARHCSAVVYKCQELSVNARHCSSQGLQLNLTKPSMTDLFCNFKHTCPPNVLSFYGRYDPSVFIYLYKKYLSSSEEDQFS